MLPGLSPTVLKLDFVDSRSQRVTDYMTAPPLPNANFLAGNKVISRRDKSTVRVAQGLTSRQSTANSRKETLAVLAPARPQVRKVSVTCLEQADCGVT
jgi:hypothetical protein